MRLTACKVHGLHIGSATRSLLYASFGVLAIVSVLYTAGCMPLVEPPTVVKIESRPCPASKPPPLTRRWKEPNFDLTFDLANGYASIRSHLSQCYDLVDKWESDWNDCQG